MQDERRLSTTEEAIGYYDGSIFLDTWIGPRLKGDTAQNRRTMEEVARVFQTANILGTVVKRHARALTGKPPIWKFTDLEGNDVDSATDADEQVKRLNRRWNELTTGMQGKLGDPFRQATRMALVCGRGYTRLFAAKKLSKLSDPILRIAIHSPHPSAVNVVRDDSDFIERIEYTYTENGKTFVEVQWVDIDTGLTNFEYRDTAGKAIADEDGETRFALDLGGRYTIYELRLEAIVTESIKQNQNAINHVLTMVPRVTEYSGFLRELILNGQPPGTWETDSATGLEKFIPAEEGLPNGPGVVNYVQGNPTYDQTGQIDGYTTPSVVTHQPTSIDSHISNYRLFSTLIYEQVGQSHVLANDLNLSGVSQQQRRADFVVMLSDDAELIAPMYGNMWMTALLMANQERKESYLSLSISVTLQLTIDQPLPEERQQIREDFKAGLLSRRTAIAKQGFVDDPDSELAQIEAERQRESATRPVNPLEGDTPTQPTENGQNGTTPPNQGTDAQYPANGNGTRSGLPNPLAKV